MAKLSEALPPMLPKTDNKTLAESALRFFIHSMVLHTKPYQGKQSQFYVLDCSRDGGEPTFAAILGYNSYREGLAEFLYANPGENIGPVYIEAGRNSDGLLVYEMKEDDSPLKEGI